MQRKTLGDIVVGTHPSQHYKTVFSQKTGFFVRLEEDGQEEPFWSEDGPELLDVSITNYCERGCDFCYRQSNLSGKHISLNDVVSVVKQAKEAGVLQIALGGGNPNQHPRFIEIIKTIRENNIVPSYTSNGEGLTTEILEATQKYCGAMALSLYPPYNCYEKLVKRITDYGIRLNLHVILKNDTIDSLTSWFKNPPALFSYINAVVVLNFKPIGGAGRELMVNDAGQLKAFYESASACKAVKIGFDSCCVPGIVTWMDVNPALIDTCEAARFSAFVSEDMKMYPCSFMVDTEQFGDLRKDRMLEIWKSHPAFVKHRESIRNNSCASCIHHSVCKGGCVFMPEINQCKNV
ncbi:MAG: radical SAM protein [Bacteroidales bacterium]|nr:radical SAM protein [Bacteroidales bacterium]